MLLQVSEAVLEIVGIYVFQEVIWSELLVREREQISSIGTNSRSKATVEESFEGGLLSLLDHLVFSEFKRLICWHVCVAN